MAKPNIVVSSSSVWSKIQQVTKHVDGTVFPYLDASSNLASSTKNPSLPERGTFWKREGFFNLLTVCYSKLSILCSHLKLTKSKIRKNPPTPSHTIPPAKPSFSPSPLGHNTWLDKQQSLLHYSPSPITPAFPASSG